MYIYCCESQLKHSFNNTCVCWYQNLSGCNILHHPDTMLLMSPKWDSVTLRPEDSSLPSPALNQVPEPCWTLPTAVGVLSYFWFYFEQMRLIKAFTMTFQLGANIFGSPVPLPPSFPPFVCLLSAATLPVYLTWDMYWDLPV